MSGDFFGDIEPEDAWDADDPVVEQVANVRRRVELLAAIAGLTQRDRLRIRHILDDLATIRHRLEEG